LPTNVDEQKIKKRLYFIMDKRTLLFLFGCMGSRLALVLVAKNYPALLKPMAILAACISFGFMYIWANGLRKTGPETFGEKIWWNDLRPVHAALYAIFALLAFNGNTEAWKVLLLDITLGFTAWILHKNMSVQ
jgi:hypothetical protein